MERFPCRIGRKLQEQNAVEKALLLDKNPRSLRNKNISELSGWGKTTSVYCHGNRAGIRKITLDQADETHLDICHQIDIGEFSKN